MSNQYGPRIVTNGLVLCLDAGNSKSYPGSGTVWNDLSGNGNNGTLVNGPTYSSLNKGSIVFDGINDRGTFTSPITVGSSQTYEVWVKAMKSDIAADNYAYILHNNGLNTSVGLSYMTIGYGWSGSGLQNGEIFACFNGNFLNMGTGVIGNTTNIRQVVLTWNGSVQSAYVDSVFRKSQALTTNPQNFSTTTSFGDDKATSYRPIIGSIYSIKIYNRALSASEVLQNYNATKGRFGL